MNYVYTVLGTTGAIILAEILGKYGLGDVVKDGAIWLYHKVIGTGKTWLMVRIQRLESHVAKLKGAL